MVNTEDTIVAIGTASGGAARGMVRLSGPQVVQCLSHCFSAADQTRLDTVDRPSVIRGSLQVSATPATSHPNTCSIPCQLFLWPDKRSYTRQPSAELHTLGSPPLLEMVLDQLGASGARSAEPGEFTLRAFLAGRIDLTQAEAVLGVIDARDANQLDVALSQLAGGLSGPLSQLRDRLLDLLAELEAGLDFADEDITFIAREEILDRLAEALAIVESVASQMAARGDQSALARIVLLGQPNAGKSSLFNALVRRQCGSRATAEALVSPQSGTTRDYLTAKLPLGELSLDGLACELVDTAGDNCNANEGTLAHAAQSTMQEQQQQADIRVLCVDSEKGVAALFSHADLTVITKSDLAKDAAQRASLTALVQKGAIPCSSKTGDGLAHVIAAIRKLLLQATSTSASGSSAVAATVTRCATSLRTATESLGRARRLAEHEQGEELVAAELRTALDHLGKVVGAVTTDDILDRIFGQFCIGK